MRMVLNGITLTLFGYCSCSNLVKVRSGVNSMFTAKKISIYVGVFMIVFD